MFRRFDTLFATFIGVTVAVGFLVFLSASLGLLARGEDIALTSLIIRQVLGIALGVIAFLVTAHIPYRLWRQYGLYLFVGALLVTLLVYIPGIGIEAGGAARWLDLGVITFQPAELLKFAFVVYYAALLAAFRQHLHRWQYGLVSTIGVLAGVALVLLPQPDTGTFVVIAATGMAMYLCAGARWRELFGLGGAGVALIGLLALSQPYILDRLATFVNPAVDPTGSGYQIQQSLIAVGSGQLFGRGFGQSVQKFNYLPEPVGDSIFAVAAEEFGFFGSCILVALLLAICLRGLKIATRAPDYYGSYLVVGLTMLVFTQSFINIGAMLNLLPLTGMPLLLVSQGGSAMVFVLAELGIIMNVARRGKRR